MSHNNDRLTAHTKCGMEAPGGFEPPHRSFAVFLSGVRPMMTLSDGLLHFPSEHNGLRSFITTGCD